MTEPPVHVHPHSTPSLPDGLTRKVGPLPIVGWAVIAGVGVGGFLLWRRRQAAAASTTTAADTSASTTDGTFSGTQATDASTAAGEDTGTYANDGSSAPTSTSTAYADNDAWRIAAENYAIGAGYDPGLVDVAVSDYLAGNARTVQETALISTIIAHVGPTPIAVPSPPTGTPITAIPAPPTAPQHKPVTAPTTTVKRPTPKPPAKAKPAAPKTYTIKSGDTLSSIASAQHYPGGWEALYAANKATIEAAAKAHGKANSGGGHYIYPGTVLAL